MTNASSSLDMTKGSSSSCLWRAVVRDIWTEKTLGWVFEPGTLDELFGLSDLYCTPAFSMSFKYTKPRGSTVCNQQPVMVAWSRLRCHSAYSVTSGWSPEWPYKRSTLCINDWMVRSKGQDTRREQLEISAQFLFNLSGSDVAWKHEGFFNQQ